MPIKVVVADDFLMSRQVFESAISASEDFELLSSLATAQEAVDYVTGKYFSEVQTRNQLENQFANAL